MQKWLKGLKIGGIIPILLSLGSKNESKAPVFVGCLRMRAKKGPIYNNSSQLNFDDTGQPQLSTLPFCVDRRQRIALAYQWDHRDTGSLLLPEGSRYAKAGGLAG